MKDADKLAQEEYNRQSKAHESRIFSRLRKYDNNYQKFLFEYAHKHDFGDNKSVAELEEEIFNNEEYHSSFIRFIDEEIGLEFLKLPSEAIKLMLEAVESTFEN